LRVEEAGGDIKVRDMREKSEERKRPRTTGEKAKRPFIGRLLRSLPAGWQKAEA